MLPPVAMTIVMAFSNAFLVMMSVGRMSFSSRFRMAFPALAHSSRLSWDSAGAEDEPAPCVPPPAHYFINIYDPHNTNLWYLAALTPTQADGACATGKLTQPTHTKLWRHLFLVGVVWWCGVVWWYGVVWCGVVVWVTREGHAEGLDGRRHRVGRVHAAARPRPRARVAHNVHPLLLVDRAGDVRAVALERGDNVQRLAATRAARLDGAWRR